MNLLRRKKWRKKCKIWFKKSVPASSVFYRIATNYQQWHVVYAKKQDGFYSPYLEKVQIFTVSYNLAQRNISLSGDVEKNPGPVSKDVASSSDVGLGSLFNCRLHRHGLRALDIGRQGDCLFRTIAFQLHSGANYHSEIRAERFIEFVEDMAWSDYISNMSMQGTWGDNVIMQAIADTLNLRIHIVESIERFSEITLVEGLNVTL